MDRSRSRGKIHEEATGEISREKSGKDVSRGPWRGKGGRTEDEVHVYDNGMGETSKEIQDVSGGRKMGQAKTRYMEEGEHPPTPLFIRERDAAQSHADPYAINPIPSQNRGRPAPNCSRSLRLWVR